MAKANVVKVKMVSTAGTGFFYTAKRNPKTKTEKYRFRKFDPRAEHPETGKRGAHVEFKEEKIK